MSSNQLWRRGNHWLNKDQLIAYNKKQEAKEETLDAEETPTEVVEDTISAEVVEETLEPKTKAKKSKKSNKK